MHGMGTIINTVAIIACGGLGMLFKKGIPQRFHDIIFTATGASTFLLGITGVLENSLKTGPDGTITSQHFLMLMLSLIIGGIIGEALKIDKGFDKLGNFLKSKIAKGSTDTDVGTGFVSVSILFCAGAMAIIGSIQDGVMGDPSMLYTKAVLDGVAALIFATVYGYGVILSAISVFVYQGLITVCAVWIGPLLSATVITQMSLVGSAVLMLIGFNLWGIKKFNLANLIPAAFMPLIFSFFL